MASQLTCILLCSLVGLPVTTQAAPSKASEDHSLRFSPTDIRKDLAQPEYLRTNSKGAQQFGQRHMVSVPYEQPSLPVPYPARDITPGMDISASRSFQSYHDEVKSATVQSLNRVNNFFSSLSLKIKDDLIQTTDHSHSVQDGQIEFNVGKFTCALCKAGVGLVQMLVATNASTEEIKAVVYKACSTLHIESPRVCQGVVDEFSPEVLTVFDQLVLDPSEICGLVFGPSCGDPYNPLDNWNVTFPPVPQPPPVYPTPPKKGSPTMRVLHLTDVHFDARYKVGTNANCGEPLCCREGKPGPGEDGAWKYGDYRSCDTPLWTLENLFSTLALQNDTFDYILWTGDLPAHNIWNQSRSDQVNVLQTVVSMLLKYFPGKPVYPSLGNHESSPVNSFPPPYITGKNSISWLYDALADSWKNWLPKDALESVKKGAYYTVSPHPGLRIISLNMNYCNNENWWMLLNTTDPAGELQWLISTLQQAEDKKEKVHILGHIPPGIDDCLRAWSWNYYKIVSRYQNIIAAQFFGHTHHDHFEVFYDVETLKIPVSVAFIAPSVTPYAGLNMGYRFYTVDGSYTNSSYQVLDHETFVLNLTKANLEDKITWEFEYSAKAAFNMSSVYPKDWDNLITRMKTDQSLLNTYNKFYAKSQGNGSAPCDSKCRKVLLCAARSGRSHDSSLCKDLSVKNDQHWANMLRSQPKHC